MESDERDSLQLKKLTLEIAEMERLWWKRPTYILAALPTLLAIIALSIGFLNGFFSAQLTKLDNQKHDLEAQIREFQGTRNALTTENETLRQDLVNKQEKLKHVVETAGRLNDTAVKMKIASQRLNLFIDKVSSGAAFDMHDVMALNHEIGRNSQQLAADLATLAAEEKK